MSTLSIRKLPREIKVALMKEAKNRGCTKTDVVIDALRKRFNLEPLQTRRQALRHFFGKMTPRDFEKFQENTSGFSAIDEEMWK